MILNISFIVISHKSLIWRKQKYDLWAISTRAKLKHFFTMHGTRLTLRSTTAHHSLICEHFLKEANEATDKWVQNLGKYLPIWFNPLSANFTKWSNILKQFVGKLATNCLSMFGHFGELAIKGLIFSSCSI